jgi:translation initiation factor 2B subunit (eIF-2B alpha/beta/delta family)
MEDKARPKKNFRNFKKGISGDDLAQFDKEFLANQINDLDDYLCEERERNAKLQGQVDLLKEQDEVNYRARKAVENLNKTLEDNNNKLREEIKSANTEIETYKNIKEPKREYILVHPETDYWPDIELGAFFASLTYIMYKAYLKI